MIKMSPEEREVAFNVGRQYPRFVEFLSNWRTSELERLPYGSSENMDVLRGRIQSLNELHKAILGRE